MILSEMLVYVATALAYAALTATALWALARGLGLSDPLRRVGLPAFSGLVLVFLALHPFPDAATMVCPQSHTVPALMPLRFLGRAVRILAGGGSPGAVLGDITIASAIMNFVVCAGFGLMLARAGMSVAAATALGFALSLSVETAQITGLFGLYPCAYRQFDVDDLILNTGGTLAGAAAGAALFGWGRRRS
jgi:hypothetical protein